MDRRTFISASLAGAAAASAVSAAVPKAAHAAKRSFKLKYAPHFGMFKHLAGDDKIDQLKFMADQGFTALEHNEMGREEPGEQERIAKEMARLGMTMGVFVSHFIVPEPTFASGKPEHLELVLDGARQAVEVAKRVNAKWCTVVPGAFDPGLEWDYQTANVIDALKRCCEIVEPAGLTMVLEPLNAWRDHPGLFLTKIPQAYMICRSVGSPACKILFDMYHQQVTEGNIVANIDRAWSEVAYFQVGDNPGRKEPTTGEMNYRNIFKHIHGKGFAGVVGMEHGNSQRGADGEKAVIAAYAACDDF